jgi:hypothetical protein
VPEDGEKHSYALLIASVAIALLILIGAAIYIGLDLRDANRIAAEQQAAESSPAVVVPVCPDGVTYGCDPARTLPVTLESWQASDMSFRESIEPTRSGVAVLVVGVPGGRLEARAAHVKSVLYEVVCVLTTDTAATPDLLHLLRNCAAATVPGGTAYTGKTEDWLSATVRATDHDARWSCGPLAIAARFSVGRYELAVTPATDPKSCDA